MNISSYLLIVLNSAYQNAERSVILSSRLYYIVRIALINDRSQQIPFLVGLSNLFICGQLIRDGFDDFDFKTHPF